MLTGQEAAAGPPGTETPPAATDDAAVQVAAGDERDDLPDLNDVPPQFSDFPEVGGVRLRADFQNLDEYTEATIAAANAEGAAAMAEDGEGEQTAGTAAAASPPPSGTTAATTAPAAAPASGPAPSTALTDEQIADFERQGYKIERPSPPPDPLVELNQQMEPFVGERTYLQHVATLQQPLPPKPDEYTLRDTPDAPEVVAYNEAVKAQDDARAALGQIEGYRKFADIVVPWMRTRTLREHGADINAMVERNPNIDRRPIDQPTSLGAIFSALETAVTARLEQKHQQEMAALERRYAGKAKLDDATSLADRADRMGRSVPASTRGGGSPSGPMPMIPTVNDPTTGLPVVTDEWLAAARSGRLAG